MEGFIQPEFGYQFSEKKWRITPRVTYSCNYCTPFEYVYTDRIIHNENAHNSLQNPILTEIVQALWGVNHD